MLLSVKKNAPTSMFLGSNGTVCLFAGMVREMDVVR